LTSIHVAVVGGGYSGTLQAIQLAERGARVTLIERDDRIGRGVAYSTVHADHLLNVRASGMSAFPDRPDHFAAWVTAQGLGDGGTFVQRRDYGRYLTGLLEAATASGRVAVRRAEVVDVAAGEEVALRGGDRIEADAVVLGSGNLAPDTPGVIAAAGLLKGVYVADPWAADLAAGLGENDDVLLIGTGLTAIDAALMLDSGGFRGRILALSRRGLLPRAHVDAPVSLKVLETLPEPHCLTLLAETRRRTERIGWRAAVDSLRPVTQSLWAGADVAERRRFLRHLRPWWDVHRHRIAPSIAARIDGMAASGRLQVAAGKIVSVAQDGQVRWRARGEAGERTLRAARIVNCTGPQADINRAGDPLLDALLAAGRVRADPCRIGVDVDADCRVISAEGQPSDTLRAVGPITRGAFWEIVAVPDIRRQVKAVAEALTA
jgi:uncharacterized NAD(P)/FAD-binding protein YdhS